jgi:hypothetical protein
MAMYTRDTAESVRGDLFTTIKRNPVPAALAAIGLGWLWSNRAGGSQGSHGPATPYGNTALWQLPRRDPFGLELAIGSGSSPYYGRTGPRGVWVVWKRGWIRVVWDPRWI